MTQMKELHKLDGSVGRYAKRSYSAFKEAVDRDEAAGTNLSNTIEAAKYHHRNVTSRESRRAREVALDDIGKLVLRKANAEDVKEDVVEAGRKQYEGNAADYQELALGEARLAGKDIHVEEQPMQQAIEVRVIPPEHK